MPCTTTATPNSSISMLIETHNQLTFDESAQMAFVTWLKERDCHLSIHTISSVAPPEGDPIKHTTDLVFGVYPLNTAPEKLRLQGITRGNVPLYSTWLVHSSTGQTTLDSLKHQRIALLQAPSVLGSSEPMALMNAVGINTNDLSIYLTEQYQGAIALLLHGDVSAASIPAPLALPWAKANNLTMIAQSEIIYASGIWQHSETPIPDACTSALINLKRENRQDQKMRVFPEWFEGFEALESLE